MDSQQRDDSPAHFKDKNALEHVIDAQAQGFVASSEIHGTELPGHLSAAADAARETAVLLAIVWSFLIQISDSNPLILLLVVVAGWAVWKTGRSAWLGWLRLERLHRILEQERWEIQHHRQQERSELKELYAAKGFEGKLLEDVLDVLMADDSRLLRVMVEEELGLSLESQEHPLKQGLGALLGTIIAAAITIGGQYLYAPFGLLIGMALVLGIGGGLSAAHTQNRVIPAVIWNIGLGAIAFATSYFLCQLLLKSL